MKLTLLQENLAKGLTIVNRFVAPKAQLPALNNVLLTTDKGKLKLSATNLEMGINYWLGAKVEQEGAISIPAKIFTEFISSLPLEKVVLETKENNLNLNCSSYQANFVGLPASEFPAVPTFKGKGGIFFPKDLLLKAITQVSFAAAQDEGRPNITGVLLIIKGEDLVLVATDGYRLSFKKMIKAQGFTQVEEFKKGIIIPARTLTEVGKIMAEQEPEKEISLAITPGSNQIIFVSPEAEVTSRLIEGSFPDFERIIPEKETTKVLLEKETFLRAVRTAAIFARESANIIKFKINKDKLKVSANAPQIGDNLIEMEIRVTGEDNKIAFNSRYLLDFLNVVEGEEVTLEMTSPLNPGVFRCLKDNSFLHIIMPVRVQE
jgi:DNA polymerase-3 subunit beta